MKKIFSAFLSTTLLLVILFSPVKVSAESQYGIVQALMATGVSSIFGCDSFVNDEINNEVNPLFEAQCTESDDQNLYITTGGKGPKVNGQEVSMTSTMYAYMGVMIDNPPAQTGVYVADLMKNLNPQAEVYAQGIGFSALTPVLGIWKAVRNVAYFFYVIAFMVIGFAIMFRAKLGAQTAINIQLALPKLVITLLLITFSYAIAGLMIDIMYFGLFLVIGILDVVVFKNTQFLYDVAFNNNFIENIFGMVFSINEDHNIVIKGAESVSSITASALGWGSTDFDLGALTGAVSGFIAGLTTGLLFILIFGIIVLINTFKVFFSLINAYIQIILLVITAPVRLLLNVYPGSKTFYTWLKELAANIAVFPVVILMLFVALMLLGSDTHDGIGYGSGSGGFAPPQLNFDSADAIQGIVGIGVLLAIPKALEATQKAFGVGGGAGGGGAFGGALLGGAAGSILGPMASPFKAGASMYGKGIQQAALGGFTREMGKTQTLRGAIKGGFEAGKGALNPKAQFEYMAGQAAKRQAQSEFYEEARRRQLAEGGVGNGSQGDATQRRTTGQRRGGSLHSSTDPLS